MLYEEELKNIIKVIDFSDPESLDDLEVFLVECLERELIPEIYDWGQDKIFMSIYFIKELKELEISVFYDEFIDPDCQDFNIIDFDEEDDTSLKRKGLFYRSYLDCSNDFKYLADEIDMALDTCIDLAVTKSRSIIPRKEFAKF